MAAIAHRRWLHLLGLMLFIVIEGYAYRRYVLLGSQFHFWLHTLFGATVGMTLATALQLVRPHLRVPGLAIGAVAHLWSAFPDVLFIGVGAVHQRWMDVFAGHISVHFIPQPIVSSAGLLLIAGLAASLVSAGRRRTASLALVAVVGLGGLAFALRSPIPTTLDDVRSDPQLVLVCPLQSPPDQPPI